MPHVDIKHYPQDFTREQTKRLAEAITAVIKEHFEVSEGAVSITVEPIAENDWQKQVVNPQITTRRHLLIKEPNAHQ